MNEKLLGILKAELSKGFINETFDVAGHKWTLHTLNEAEESWIDGKISTKSNVDFVKSRTRPTIAISLQAIDGVVVSEIFSPNNKDEDKIFKAIITSSADNEFPIAEEVNKFLATLDRETINELSKAFGKLLEKRNEVVKHLKN